MQPSPSHLHSLKNEEMNAHCECIEEEHEIKSKSVTINNLKKLIIYEHDL
jgi:hypothetical protein